MSGLEVAALASPVIRLATLYNATAEILLGFDLKEFRLLRQEIENTERSLRILGELMAGTKAIFKDDLNLATKVYLSAVAQIIVVKQGLEVYIRPSNSSKSLRKWFDRRSAKSSYYKALADIESINGHVEALRQILIIAYWDGVEPAPTAEHSALDKELMSNQVYQRVMPEKFSSTNTDFDMSRTLSVGDMAHSHDDTFSSSSQDNRQPLTSHQSVALGRMTVDEAFGLMEVTEEGKEPSLSTEDYESTSCSFYTGSDMPRGPGTAPQVNLTICMHGDSGTTQNLNCLLDTGALADCISRDCAKRLAPGDTDLIRRTRTPIRLQTANGEIIESRLKFNGVWRFLNKNCEYKHEFYLIDGLPTDVVISRGTIFEQNFLVQNPELMKLGLPDEPTGAPGLNILYFAEASKAQEKQQKASKSKKDKVNENERSRQTKELFERLMEAKRQRQKSSSGQSQGLPASTT